MPSNIERNMGGICWFDGKNIIGEVFKFFSGRLELTIPQKDPSDSPLSLREQANWCWGMYPYQESQKLPVLVVFDDVTDIETLQAVIPRDSHFRILITTRLRNIDPNFIQTVILDVLQLDEAVALLKSLLGEQDRRVEREDATARQLGEWLGCLPLAIELVGVYLANDPDLSLQKILQRLEAKGLAEPSLTNPSQRGIRAAFELTWEKLDPIPQQVGMFLSLFSPSAILWQLVEDVAKGEELAEGQKQPIWSEEALNEGKKQLYKHHLLQLIPEAEGYYQIHSLVHLFLQEKLTNFLVSEAALGKKLTQTFTDTMVNIAQTIPDTPTLENIKWFQFFIPHLEELGSRLAQNITMTLSPVADDLIPWIFTGIGRFYQGQGLYEAAEPWYQVCGQVIKTRLGDEHPHVASSLNNLAALYHSQGRYDEAEPLLKEALELCKCLLGDEHPHVASSLNNLALLYHSQGRYDEAEPLLKETLGLYKRLLGDEHPHVATSLNNLAALYDSQGRYDEAEPLYKEALELYKRLLGDEHPNVASSLNNLAGLYHSQGRYNEAEPLYKAALELRERYLGNEHPHVAQSLNNLAELYRYQGRYNEAKPLYKEALELYKRLLGDEHPDVATSLNNLAALYDSQGRYDEAEPLYKAALEILIRTVGENHPHTVTCRNNFAYLQSQRYLPSRSWLQQIFHRLRSLWQWVRQLLRGKRR
jgi:tetratricopeptide (TPR) repeat protein